MSTFYATDIITLADGSEHDVREGRGGLYTREQWDSEEEPMVQFGRDGLAVQTPALVGATIRRI